MDDDTMGSEHVNSSQAHFIFSPPFPQASSPSLLETPSVEIMEPSISTRPIPPMHLALRLWFEKCGASRQDCTRLREIIHLATEEMELPANLHTLRKRVRTHLPMLRLMRQAIPVVFEKQPSLAVRDKKMDVVRKTSWFYWYDPVDLVLDMLAAGILRDKMYFGMAQYSDSLTELWHSRAWGYSIWAMSGDVIYDLEGEILVPGDIVGFVAVEGINKGRVIFIERDFRSSADEIGQVIITLQAILTFDELSARFWNLDDSDERQLYLAEDILLELSSFLIHNHIDVFLVWEHRGNEADQELPRDEGFYIRQVVNNMSENIRPLRQLPPTRGELEVYHFGREHLIDMLKQGILTTIFPVY